MSGTDIFQGERLQRYPDNSNIGRYHKTAVCRGLIDTAFIGWKYNTNSSLIEEVKRAKNCGPGYASYAAEHIGRFGWKDLRASIQGWSSQLGTGLTIIPVPSRCGFSEALANSLVSTLCSPVAMATQHAFRRTDVATEMKKITSPRDRELASFSLVALTQEVAAGGSVLLVDDVVTTGSTLRACANLLRIAGVRNIGAAVIAGSFAAIPNNQIMLDKN